MHEIDLRIESRESIDRILSTVDIGFRVGLILEYCLHHRLNEPPNRQPEHCELQLWQASHPLPLQLR